MPRPDKDQNRIEFLQRSLDIRIALALRINPMRGYAIPQRIRSRSAKVLALMNVSPDPTRHRLERRKCTQPEWKLTNSQQRAMACQFSVLGTKQLGNGHQRWLQIGRALSAVMDPEVHA